MKTTAFLCLSWLACASLSAGQGLSGVGAEAFEAEKAIWQSEVDGDVDAFRALLAPDFFQVTTGPDAAPSRVSGRDAAADGVAGALETMAFGEFELSEPHAKVLGTTVVLSYVFEQEYLPRSGEAATRIEGVATSVWSKESGEWRNVHFHWHSQPLEND